MSDLVVALAGGSIGSLLTVGFGQAAQAKLAWTEVEANEVEAADLNAQLAAWVDDRTLMLVRETQQVSDEFNARGVFMSSMHASRLADAKALALHQFRDQETQSGRAFQRLLANESHWHHAWRGLRHRPAPRLTARTKSGAVP